MSLVHELDCISWVILRETTQNSFKEYISKFCWPHNNVKNAELSRAVSAVNCAIELSKCLILCCNSVPLFWCLPFHSILIPMLTPLKSPATFTQSRHMGLFPWSNKCTASSNHSLCKLAIIHSFPHTSIHRHILRNSLSAVMPLFGSQSKQHPVLCQAVCCAQMSPDCLTLSTSVPSFLSSLPMSNQRHHLLTKYIL